MGRRKKRRTLRTVHWARRKPPKTFQCPECGSVSISVKIEEKGEKRVVKEVIAQDPASLLNSIMANTPEGFRFIGARLKPSSKNTWQIEYEREDIFEMRCS